MAEGANGGYRTAKKISRQIETDFIRRKKGKTTCEENGGGHCEKAGRKKSRSQGSSNFEEIKKIRLTHIEHQLLY